VCIASHKSAEPNSLVVMMASRAPESRSEGRAELQRSARGRPADSRMDDADATQAGSLAESIESGSILGLPSLRRACGYLCRPAC
jgi:hypothetical protein